MKLKTRLITGMVLVVKEDSTEKLDYDYSSYDREDDHSNVYDNEMYD